MVGTLWGAFVFVVLVIVAAGLVVRTLRLRQITVFEFQRGLKYRKGRFAETLDPGTYLIWPARTNITVVDVRNMVVTIPGQEVISADGVTLKISLIAEYVVADPAKAIHNNTSYHTAFYLLMQMAVRQLVGGEKLEAILEQKVSLSDRVSEATRDKVSALGLKLVSAEVKDVMLPGELRRTFAQVVKAQKEGQAALERARGETAALRSLANAAKMAEDNPNLLQLRALQMMADSSGNTIMLGVPGAVPAPTRKNGDRRSERDSTEN